ncbi:methyltransferase [Geothrix rubra]|uniref:Methyltransferase n=1 Tax=Geothrix rubra TaxID=2927977 RepID=A0ABQ5Q8D7_9BACT|nr:class I SAM-dependent methyltransferase [Geothrix rubra]GLH71079.1 methyltransferase [Geothrix rubra]
MSEFDLKARDWDADADKVARAERVAAAIRAQVGDLSGRSALEVGCGTGLLGFALRPHVARMTLADTSAGMLEVLREKIAASGLPGMEALQHDFTQGPLPADRYGLLCNLMTLHHIPDTEDAFRRFHGLLEPGGLLCIADLDTEDGSFHGAGVEVHHGFDREGLRAGLERAGFRDIRFDTPYVIDRGGKRYPVFLVVAVRP